METKPLQLDVYRTAIAMRGFEHAAASRKIAEAIVVKLTLDDGRIGWGETLPRDYVTGETLESVVDDITDIHWPAYCENPSALLAEKADGRVVTAAACAIATADLDAINGFGELGELSPRIDARVSGVLGSADPAKVAKKLRLMRLIGLRDFKLKLGFGEQTDAEILRIVSGKLGKQIAKGKCTLRVDVNGGWDIDSTPQRVEQMFDFGVCVVEQPVYCAPEQLVELARKCKLPLMADESLLTTDDAQILLAEPQRIWWNIRIAKNGGPARALAMAKLAGKNDVKFTLGCMVGETCILSAAQRRVLQLAPAPRFVEGNYGRFLMDDDLTVRSPRFGYGGKLKAIGGAGLGVNVSQESVDRYGELLKTLHAGF